MAKLQLYKGMVAPTGKRVDDVAEQPELVTRVLQIAQRVLASPPRSTQQEQARRNPQGR